MIAADWLRGFIPKHISNRTVLGFFEFLRKLQGIDRCIRDLLFRKEETEATESKPLHIRGFMENQHIYGDIPYGRADIAYSGCEIIAVYNVLLDAQRFFKENAANRPSLPVFTELVREFEKDGMVAGGRFGTSPGAIRDYLKKTGLQISFSFDNRKFKQMARESDSLILTMYNDVKDITKEVHTIAITKDEVGYTAHNAYCNGRVVGPYITFDDLMWHLNEGRSRGICLIGIKVSPKE